MSEYTFLCAVVAAVIAATLIIGVAFNRSSRANDRPGSKCERINMIIRNSRWHRRQILFHGRHINDAAWRQRRIGWHYEELRKNEAELIRLHGYSHSSEESHELILVVRKGCDYEKALRRIMQIRLRKQTRNNRKRVIYQRHQGE